MPFPAPRASLALLLPALFLSLPLSGSGRLEPGKEDFLSSMLFKSLSSFHYHSPKVDDGFSKRSFKLLLKRMDPQKRFLVKADIDSLKSFETRLDDQFRQGSYAFVDVSHKIQRRRLLQAQGWTRSFLAQPLDFTANDSLQIDPDKQDFAADTVELKNRWRKTLKYQVLLRMAEAKEVQEKIAKDSTARKAAPKPQKGGKDASPRPPEKGDTEQEARRAVLRSNERAFERMLKEDRFERVSGFLNAVANAYDPHTEYFKPETKEDFDISMKGTLEGIGAVLREEDGFIKVVSIVPGSASWRQKDLKAEDKILKVAQGKEEAVDVVNATVNEAVKLIRGPKGTEVRLTVQKPDGRIQVIPIIRDVVVVEETYARSAILQDEKGRKYGYIDLPGFYRDFNNREARNASGDVRKELERLSAQKVEGVVVDLRNNGGGALDDAVRMAGLFYKTGPAVQVKDQRGDIKVLNDSDPSIVYGGPVVVLINTFSASASEIVSAALQDYGRAVIFGTGHSFGKGTVQTILDLDTYLPGSFDHLKPMGSLKLTIQKFYRINGGSTQYKGVIPDIQMPDPYTEVEIGEKTMDYALPFDEVKPMKFEKWARAPDLDFLRKRSQARMKSDKAYVTLTEYLESLKKRREDTWVNIERKAFLEERETMRKEGEKFENLQKQLVHMTITDSQGKAAPKAKEGAEGEEDRDAKWYEGKSRDIYIKEGLAILGDMIDGKVAAR